MWLVTPLIVQKKNSFLIRIGFLLWKLERFQTFLNVKRKEKNFRIFRGGGANKLGWHTLRLSVD